MTAPKPYRWTQDTTLYITDAELIRRMGVPEKIAREAIRELDRSKGTGFPQKQALFGNRRYWPAVKAWLDRRNGLGAANAAQDSRRPRNSMENPETWMGGQMAGPHRSSAARVPAQERPPVGRGRG